jgi:transmembrane sensor
MASRFEPEVEAQAIAWVIRLRDADAAGWAAFTQWLEQSPVHSAAFDAAALADRQIASAMAASPDALPGLKGANDNHRQPLARWIAIAATLLLGLVAYPLYRITFPNYAIETQLGEQRVVALADGTKIALNGGTRLLVRRSDERQITMDRGEASFTVVHNAKDPFTVQTPAGTFVDLGTIFNIRQDGDVIETSVSQGRVRFESQATPVLVAEGQILQVKGPGSKPTVSDQAQSDQSDWQAGRLSYQSQPLPRVATDLSRLLGVRIAIDGSLAEHRFTGSLVVNRSDPQAMVGIAALLGVTAKPDQDGWILAAN